jgi:hypothetical protein
VADDGAAPDPDGVAPGVVAVVVCRDVADRLFGRLADVGEDVAGLLEVGIDDDDVVLKTTQVWLLPPKTVGSVG